MIEIPGYTVLRPIGSGGMAKVYLAVQQSLGREVALKILSPALAQDAGASERFLREARLAANLHHPLIVPIHDVGMHEDLAFIAMQFEPGGPVSMLAGACDSVQALRIVRDIATALDYAHGKGVVHRDIKPDNILQRADGSSVLSDFGIARVMESDSALTREGTSVGTPQYMSPEQLRGERVDGRADIYSLGVVLYQLLTGQLPYRGSDGWAIGMQHMNAEIPRLPPAMAGVQPLLDRMMAKNAGSRPQTGAEVVRQIDGLLSGAIPAASTTPLAAAMPISRPARSWKLMLAGVVAVVLAIAVFASWEFRSAHPRLGAARPPPKQLLKSLEAGNSIAVMPFVDKSKKRDQEYFADGISEELLSQLARVDGLRVAARTSSFAFKTGSHDVREIARKLNVSHLLEGSVRREGNRVRITAELIDARSGFDLWSESYDRELHGIFAVQDEITKAIVAALQIKLAITPAQSRSVDPEAYDLFLRGIFYSNKSSEADLRQSLQMFQRALDKDPGNARAWTGIAKDWLWLADAYVKPLEAYPQSRAAALKALALDPNDADAHVYVGEAKRVLDWDLPGAEAEYRRALQLDPNSSATHFTLALLLSSQGHRGQGIQEMRKALALDPLSPVISDFASMVYLSAGRFEDAIAEGKRTIAIDPNFLYSDSRLAAAYREAGRYDEAIAIYQKAAKDTGEPQAGLAITYAKMGRTREALDIAAALESKARRQYVAGETIAGIYSALGDRDAAFKWLERAYVEHSAPLHALGNSPVYRPLYGDPRFAALLRKIGLRPDPATGGMLFYPD